MGKHWIVLVNKSPRGPLTFEEVSALLNEKIIKRTDLALVISTENSEEKADWKFLWQYPEFDLRLKRTEDNPPPLKLEQRQPQNSVQIKAQISESLPDEIAMISPEDLIVSVKKGRAKGPVPLSFSDKEEEEDSLSYSGAQPGNAKWGYAVLGLFILIVGGWVKSTFFETPEVEVTKNSSNIVRTPAKTDVAVAIPKAKPNEKSKGGVQTRTHQPEKPTESAQSATPPKKNEISLEEYQKMKEANAAKERAQEDEQQRLNEEAENLANARGSEGDGQDAEGEETDKHIEALVRKRLKKITLKDLKKRKLIEEGQESQEAQDRDPAEDGKGEGAERDSERDQERDRDR
jgi:hypothetical protein